MRESIQIPWRGRPSEGRLVEFMREILPDLQRGMVRSVYLIVEDWHLAKDVFQESFLALFLALRRGKAMDDLRAWYSSVCRNIAVSQARKRAAYIKFFSGNPELLANLAAPKEINAELWDLTDEWISELPERQKQAVELVYLDGLSPEDAANRMDCAENTVRKHCVLGRKKLKKKAEKWQKKNMS